MLKRLKLSIVIALKEKLEKSLLVTMDNYENNNQVNETTIKYIRRMSNQLNILKLAINRGNSKRHPIILFGKRIKLPFGHTNHYYIYDLSEEKRLSKAFHLDLKNNRKIESIKKKLTWFNNNKHVIVNIYNDLKLI